MATALKLVTKGHRTKRELEVREQKLAYQLANPDLFVTAQYKYRKINPLKYLYRLAKHRAIKRGVEFNIEHTDLKLPKKCPLLDIELNSAHPDIDYHYSIDRVDNTRGYVKGNVMIISHRANRLKNDSNATELLLLGTNLSKFEAIS